MAKLQSRFLLLIFMLMLTGCSSLKEATKEESSTEKVKGDQKQISQLEQILKVGVIKVGTTGDYRPFTYFNPDTKEFEGYDIDAAKKLAEDMGVEVTFVETSWPDLMDDLKTGAFDIGMGGITRTLERQKTAQLSPPYLDFGKGALIKAEDKDRFKSIDDINKPEVKIGVNPGGTNEQFVRSFLPKADVTVVENNLEIPPQVAEGTFDVMITDNVEAIIYAKEDNRLFTAFEEETLTHSQMGYLMKQGKTDFHNWINLWMDEMEINGEFEKLNKKWIH